VGVVNEPNLVLLLLQPQNPLTAKCHLGKVLRSLRLSWTSKSNPILRGVDTYMILLATTTTVHRAILFFGHLTRVRLLLQFALFWF